MRIGTFTRSADRFTGRLHTLALDQAVCLLPRDPGGNPRAPDWQVCMLGPDDQPGPEIGAGWSDAAGSDAGIAIALDCPTFPRKVRARLVPEIEGTAHHVLLWIHRQRRAGETD
jgi:uncharacterized protein (DUF736 family)